MESSLRCRMDKLKQKLHMPKAKTFHGEARSLDVMVRESMYFVWPAAGISQDNQKEVKRHLARQDGFYESDPEDDDER